MVLVAARNQRPQPARGKTACAKSCVWLLRTIFCIETSGVRRSRTVRNAKSQTTADEDDRWRFERKQYAGVIQALPKPEKGKAPPGCVSNV